MEWLSGIWNDIVNYFTNNWVNILLFFAILIIGIIVIKIVMTIVRKVLGRTKMEKIAQQFLCTILKFVLWLVLILLLLSQIGVEITGLLTALSAVILAVGMALQNAIANVANGIIIISSHMFKKGDYIIINGVEGSITDINFMFTTLITVDNRKVTLPNSSILTSNVTNLGAYPKRRVDFTFSVAYESDTELVKKIVTDVMKSDGRVYLDPAPFCRLKTLGASSIDFFANCWCDNSDYWDVYYYIMENVYNEFKRNNISVPYNQVEVRERKDKVKMPVVGKKLPARVEKERKEEPHHELFNVNFEKSKKGRKDKKRLKAEKKQEAEKVETVKAEEAARVFMSQPERVEPQAEQPKAEDAAKVEKAPKASRASKKPAAKASTTKTSQAPRTSKKSGKQKTETVVKDKPKTKKQAKK